MSHLPLYNFLIIPIASALAFLVSLTIFLQPVAERYMKYFSIFLLINLLLDIYTNYTAFYRINNHFLNNMDTVLVISFELYLIREIIASTKAKKIFTYIFLLYPLIAVANIFLVQRFGNFHTMTYSLGSLLIVTGCIYYFWELFQQKTSIDLIRQPAFWICSGLLFFYACTFPLYGLSDFLSNLPQVVIQNLVTILNVIFICLYLSFTIAFLCRLKIKRSMSM